MIRVSVEVREGADRFEVEAYADSISQAVGITQRRFPGGDARVMFPIDGEEFFGGRGRADREAKDDGRPKPLPDRVR